MGTTMQKPRGHRVVLALPCSSLRYGSGGSAGFCRLHLGPRGAERDAKRSLYPGLLRVGTRDGS